MKIINNGGTMPLEGLIRTKKKSTPKHLKNFPQTTLSIVEEIRMGNFDRFWARYDMPVRNYIRGKIRSCMRNSSFHVDLQEGHFISYAHEKIANALRTFKFDCELRGMIATCLTQVVFDVTQRELPKKNTKDDGYHTGQSVFPTGALDDPVISGKNNDDNEEMTLRDVIVDSLSPDKIKDDNYKIALAAAALTRAAITLSQRTKSKKKPAAISMIIKGKYTAQEIANVIGVSQQAISLIKIELRQEFDKEMKDYDDDKLWFKATSDYAVNLYDVIDEICDDVEAELNMIGMRHA